MICFQRDAPTSGPRLTAGASVEARAVAAHGEGEFMKTTLTMEYWRDGDWYVGRLCEVPGVFSQGKTLAELDENLRDAYRLVLKDQKPVRRKGARRRPLALAV